MRFVKETSPCHPSKPHTNSVLSLEPSAFCAPRGLSLPTSSMACLHVRALGRLDECVHNIQGPVDFYPRTDSFNHHLDDSASEP